MKPSDIRRLKTMNKIHKIEDDYLMKEYISITKGKTTKEIQKINKKILSILNNINIEELISLPSTNRD